MKDLHLTMQIRNNLLRKRRVDRGLSCVALCEQAGIDLAKYRELERLQLPPRCCPVLRICRIPNCTNKANFPRQMLCKKHRETPKPLPPLKRGIDDWRPEVVALAKFYGCEPAALFPADVMCVEKSTFEKEMDSSELAGLLPEPSSSMDPESLLQLEGIPNLMSEEVMQAVSTLSPRLQRVLTLRFGLNGEEQRTLKQVGEELGVCTQRARSLEWDALRLLRHPRRSKRLAPLLEP